MINNEKEKDDYNDLSEEASSEWQMKRISLKLSPTEIKMLEELTEINKRPNVSALARKAIKDYYNKIMFPDSEDDKKE